VKEFFISEVLSAVWHQQS